MLRKSHVLRGGSTEQSHWSVGNLRKVRCTNEEHRLRCALGVISARKENSASLFHLQAWMLELVQARRGCGRVCKQLLTHIMYQPSICTWWKPSTRRMLDMKKPVSELFPSHPVLLKPLNPADVHRQIPDVNCAFRHILF